MSTREPGSEARWRADPRLPAYLVAGFGALVAALATGQAVLVALGAPFLVLAALGLSDREPFALAGAVELDALRAVEGGEVAGTVTVEWRGDADVDVLLTGARGVTPVDPAPVLAWSLPAASGPATFRFRLRADAWGVHETGELWVRARRPGSLRMEERKLADAPTLRILPTTLRLSRLLEPTEARASAGMHVARQRGHGTDFAELRPYRPGDRLRDISWATSARLGTPWVRVNHPERTGTVLLLLDVVFGDDAGGNEALARAARAAWAVASAHLQVQDRVGLLATGRTAAWLPPRGGRRARWMLLDALLGVGGAAERQARPRGQRSRVEVPHDALIVGVSTLRSQMFLPPLLHYRRVGHAVAVLVIDTEDLLPDTGDAVDRATRALWRAQRDAERHALVRAGIPTALVTVTDGVGPAVQTLRRRLDALSHPNRAAVRAG
ncbi:MAG: DUF58 domain-containing protein [Gemmatimonadota bacterium]